MKITKRIFTTFIIILLILLLLFTVTKVAIKTLFPTDYAEIISIECVEYKIDPYLLIALIKAESNFVSDAQSHKDAIGLMQITEPTAAWIAEQMNHENYTKLQLTTPEINIELGTWYLAYLMDLYDGNETLALCAYNAGQGNVDEWLKNSDYSANGVDLDTIPFPETEEYVNKIKRYRQLYRKIYPDLF